MARGPGVTDPEPRLAAGVALHPHTRTSERQDRARAEEPGSQELRAGSSRFGLSPRPPLPADRKLRCPGARLSVFHLRLHGPLSSLAHSFLSQTADPQASAASWSRKPPLRGRVPGRVARASSHSPRHPGRLFAEVKLVDSRDLGEARALGVSKPFL